MKHKPIVIPLSPTDFKSPSDFTATYLDGDSLTIGGLPAALTITDVSQFVYIKQVCTGREGAIYENASGSCWFDYAAGVLTIHGCGDAPFAPGDVFEIGINGQSISSTIAENSGAIPVATHRSPVDFTAAFTSNITITLAGLPFAIVDNSQLVYIKQILAANTSKIWINGKNCTLTEAGGVITIHGGGTPFVAADDYEIGINSQKKAYDSTQSADKIIEQAPVWDHFAGPIPHVTVAHEITNVFTDLGGEIDMRTYNQLGGFLTVDIGTSTNVQIRILHKHTSAGAEEYREIYLGGPVANITTINLNDYEVNTDADQLFKINIPTSNTSPYIQLQVKDDADGTGQIDAVTLFKSWSN